ncbi:MAG: hypothetical protein EBU46_00120 [Nitrosomonadaceae bacterium]|nr:hypothetical protein [Nitrosomonadaceae bacterium]
MIKIHDSDGLSYTTANGILFSGSKNCLKIRVNNYRNLYLKDIAAALAEFVQWHTLEIYPTMSTKPNFKKYPPTFVWMD